MKHAFFSNNVAVEVVSADPFAIFNPAYAALFEAVPDEVVVGWRKTGQGYVPPFQDAKADIKVSPVEFKLLFTAQERVAIKSARATDPVIDDFFDIVEDPRLTHVNLGLTSTQEALAYLEAQGLITTTRRQEILACQVK